LYPYKKKEKKKKISLVIILNAHGDVLCAI
jgi:hypothetical protein